MKKIKTIIVGQGEKPTSVINDSLSGLLFEAKSYGVERILGMRNGIEGLLDLKHGNVIDITSWNNLAVRDRPGAVLGNTSLDLSVPNDNEKINCINENLKKLNVDGIVYFGGRNSARNLQSIGDEINVIHGVASTDNDLFGCHVSPGFGSAALFNVRLARSLALDLFSYSTGNSGCFGIAPVVIYETMGKDTGWLALATAFARLNAKELGVPFPDIIWPSEIPFTHKLYLDRLDDVLSKNGKAFVVLSEGVSAGGSKNLESRVPLAQLYNEIGLRSSCSLEYGGPRGVSSGEYVAYLTDKEIRPKNVQRIKSTLVFSQNIQRSYERAQADYLQAFEVGRESLNALMQGETQKSIVVEKPNQRNLFVTSRVPIQEVAGKINYVPEKFYDSINGPTPEFLREFGYCVMQRGKFDFLLEMDFSKKVVL